MEDIVETHRGSGGPKALIGKQNTNLEVLQAKKIQIAVSSASSKSGKITNKNNGSSKNSQAKTLSDEAALKYQ